MYKYILAMFNNPNKHLFTLLTVQHNVRRQNTDFESSSHLYADAIIRRHMCLTLTSMV